MRYIIIVDGAHGYPEKIGREDMISRKPKDILFIGHSMIEFFDWSGRFPEHNVANLGVAGETAEGLLGRVDGIIRRFPEADLIFIMTGSNNIVMEDYDFMDSYGAIIRKLSRAYPGAGIYIHSVLPMLLEWVSDHKVREVNDSIQALAKTLGVSYLDIHRFFVDENGSPVRAYLRDDGVHLNDAGYDMWSAVIEEIVNG